MLLVAFLGLLLLGHSAQAPCADLAACLTSADAARQTKDYEAFHDLAWAAYRKGKSNDPELMLLVARAQSLSGRPLDALVMLDRLAALGVQTDAMTSDDFARVRALARWPEVEEKLKSLPAPAAASAKDPAPSAKAPAPSAKDPAPPAKDPAPPAKHPAPSAKAPAPPAKDPAPSAKAPAPSPKDPPPSPKDLEFTTLLTPTALAHDAVSQRYLIADRKARRIAVVDGNSGQVATLVGEQGALGDISGMAIDPRQGDLWVVSANDEGMSLHKLQLVSGRMLSTVPLALEHPVVSVAYVRDAGLIAADADGVIWRIRSNGRTERLAALEYVPLGLGTDARGRLYVAGGTSRLARFAVGATLRRIDVIDVDPSIPADAPFVVRGNTLTFVVPAQGAYLVRSVGVK